MPKKTGFTLIELLISVSIIAVLSAIGLVVYSSVLKQGRDSKRQSDLRSIQSALEQYYSDQLNYPTGITAGSPLSAGTKTYMKTVPTGSPAYVYTALGTNCAVSTPQNCTSYCLYADLENTSPGLSGCAANGTNDFAVTPP